MIEVPLVAKSKFNFCAIGKNGENEVGAVTIIVFQKHRFTQQSDKCLVLCEEVIVCLICDDQPEIKVRIGISRAPGIGATDKSGDHTLIYLASCYKAVRNHLVVKRHL